MSTTAKTRRPAAKVLRQADPRARLSVPVKAAAKAPAPTALRSLKDTSASIALLGRLQRELARRSGKAEDRIAAITAQLAAQTDDLRQQIEQLQRGIRTWCEANRLGITKGGSTKTANLATGEVLWRLGQPSLAISDNDAALARLNAVGMQCYIATKEAPDRSAMLQDIAAAKRSTSKDDPESRALVKRVEQLLALPGIEYVAATETFVVKPFGIQGAAS